MQRLAVGAPLLLPPVPATGLVILYHSVETVPQPRGPRAIIEIQTKLARMYLSAFAAFDKCPYRRRDQAGQWFQRQPGCVQQRQAIPAPGAIRPQGPEESVQLAVARFTRSRGYFLSLNRLDA